MIRSQCRIGRVVWFLRPWWKADWTWDKLEVTAGQIVAADDGGVSLMVENNLILFVHPADVFGEKEQAEAQVQRLRDCGVTPEPWERVDKIQSVVTLFKQY